MEPWKPTSYPSLSPYLIASDAEALIAFIETAFDGKLLRRFDRDDGSLMHAEIKVDDSVVMIGGGATDVQASAPHLHLYVANAAAVFARAVAAGATVVQQPARRSEGDDLRGGVRDPSGTTWWIASQ